MTRQITGRPLWSGGLRSAISTSSSARINLVDCTEWCALGIPLHMNRCAYDVMLPVFNVCVNERVSGVHSNFPGIHKHIPCQLRTDSGRKEARRLIDPPGAQTFTVQRIVKDAGDTTQLYKKVLGAKELLRIEAQRGPPNYELEHRQ